MSAWAQLVLSNGSDEHLRQCEEALAEVKSQARRTTLAQIADWLSDLSLNDGYTDTVGRHKITVENLGGPGSDISDVAKAIGAILERRGGST